MPDFPVIEAQGLTRIHGTGDTALAALDGVNLSVAHGEFVAVMGPSGCGKSTLLHLLGGLDAPSRGSVLFEGQPVHKLSDDALTQLRRRKIGYVFQFFNLIPVLTAIENAALPLVLDGIAPAVARTKAATLLERVGLGSRMHNRPDQLRRTCTIQTALQQSETTSGCNANASAPNIENHLGLVTLCGQ